jgi:hypothetical protein
MVIIRFKILFQDLCNAKDRPLPDRKWHLLRSSLEEGQSHDATLTPCQMSSGHCGFCDASLNAYAGVVYLLMETAAGHTVKFVAAKTRVSPLKEQTIPCLELLSALLLARLMVRITQSLECELQLSPPHYSTVALCCIKGTDKS